MFRKNLKLKASEASCKAGDGYLQQVAMYGSSSEELVLPVDLERSSDGTCIAVGVILVLQPEGETHTAEFA